MSNVDDKTEDKRVKSVQDPNEAYRKWTRTRKPNKKIANWAPVITKYRKKVGFVNHRGDFFGHITGRVKITPGEWILRVTRPNGECCPNLISNTVNPV